MNHRTEVFPESLKGGGRPSRVPAAVTDIDYLKRCRLLLLRETFLHVPVEMLLPFHRRTARQICLEAGVA